MLVRDFYKLYAYMQRYFSLVLIVSNSLIIEMFLIGIGICAGFSLVFGLLGNMVGVEVVMVVKAVKVG